MKQNHKNLNNSKEGRIKRNKEQMVKMEKQNKDNKLNFCHLRTHIKYKWSKCTKQKEEIVRLDRKERPYQTRLTKKDSNPHKKHIKYKEINKLKVKG